MLKVLTPVEREGKTYWTKCGVFFEKRGGQPGEGTVLLDALPVNGKLVIMPGDRPEQRRPTPDTRSDTEPAMPTPHDEDIPF